MICSQLAMILSGSEISTHLIDSQNSVNPPSIRALYDQYAPSIFGIILKVCSNKELAGILLQNVFHRLQKEQVVAKPEGCRLFTRILQITIEVCEQTLALPRSAIVSRFSQHRIH